jgi:hypothetical protein
MSITSTWTPGPGREGAGGVGQGGGEQLRRGQVHEVAALALPSGGDQAAADGGVAGGAGVGVVQADLGEGGAALVGREVAVEGVAADGDGLQDRTGGGAGERAEVQREAGGLVLQRQGAGLGGGGAEVGGGAVADAHKGDLPGRQAAEGGEHEGLARAGLELPRREVGQQAAAEAGVEGGDVAGGILGDAQDQEVGGGVEGRVVGEADGERGGGGQADSEISTGG